MKPVKKLRTVLFLSLALVLAVPGVIPCTTAITSEAATVKLNKKELTLEVNKSSKLKISGTTKKVTWSTNKKAVATVNKNGKVTAKKAGSAKITAKVDGKKYVCNVTVESKENPYIAKAPFEAKEESLGDISFVVPKAYTLLDTTDGVAAIYYPTANNPDTDGSSVVVAIAQTGTPAPDYATVKETYIELYAQLLTPMGIEDYEISDYELELGTTFVISYVASEDDNTYVTTIHVLNIDGYIIEVDSINHEGVISEPDVKSVAEYILKSIAVK